MCVCRYIYYIYIGKTYSIDNYEMANATVFNTLDPQLTNINSTGIEIQKPKGQWNLISSAGEPEHF